MKRILIAIILGTTAMGVEADEGGGGTSAFQAALTPTIALHSKDTRINGFSIAVWGENPQSAFALGFVNGSTGESKGLAWGLYNYTEKYTGVQLGIVNTSSELFVGLQDGVVNWSKEVHGVQLGVFNYTENLQGVQLGFANIVTTNPWFKELPDKFAYGFPFVNWSF
jgi:hypothetical protein